MWEKIILWWDSRKSIAWSDPREIQEEKITWKA